MIELNRPTRELEWDLTINGTTVRVSAADLDELINAAAFRLSIQSGAVVGGATGVELWYPGGARIHLCYSDEADSFAARVVKAAGTLGVTV